MVSCVSHHIVARSPINYPRFSLITWTSWQDMPGRIHPTTRPCFLHAFWRTRAVHLAKREIEHLFFMEEIEGERVCVKWDRCVCMRARVCVFLLCVIVMHLSESGDDRQLIREAEAQWLMPGLSDWQRRTYHRFSSPALSVINLICLILKVEAPLSAGTRSCNLKSILKNRVIFEVCSVQLVSLRPNGCSVLEEMASLLSIIWTVDI